MPFPVLSLWPKVQKCNSFVVCFVGRRVWSVPGYFGGLLMLGGSCEVSRIETVPAALKASANLYLFGQTIF